MSDPRDGEVICARCRTKLNRTDMLCWRCGSSFLEPVAPPIQSKFEERAWEIVIDPKDLLPTWKFK